MLHWRGENECQIGSNRGPRGTVRENVGGEGTLVRRFWHSLQAVEARFILPSSECPLPPFGG